MKRKNFCRRGCKKKKKNMEKKKRKKKKQRTLVQNTGVQPVWGKGFTHDRGQAHLDNQRFVCTPDVRLVKPVQ